MNFAISSDDVGRTSRLSHRQSVRVLSAAMLHAGGAVVIRGDLVSPASLRIPCEWIENDGPTPVDGRWLVLDCQQARGSNAVAHELVISPPEE